MKNAIQKEINDSNVLLNVCRTSQKWSALLKKKNEKEKKKFKKIIEKQVIKRVREEKNWITQNEWFARHLRKLYTIFIHFRWVYKSFVSAKWMQIY